MWAHRSGGHGERFGGFVVSEQDVQPGRRDLGQTSKGGQRPGARLIGSHAIHRSAIGPTLR